MSKSYDYVFMMKDLSSVDKAFDNCKHIVDSVISRIGELKKEQDMLPNWCKIEDPEAGTMLNILYDIKCPGKSSSGIDFETADGKVYELAFWHECNDNKFKFKLRKRTKKELKRFKEIEKALKNMTLEELLSVIN